MTLRIRRLDIDIATEDGRYGADLTFEVGLNIIRAENTSGKSTCLQSMIYALGLEGALGPSRAVPLSPAVTRAILVNEGKEIPVLTSDVYIEIENANKQIAVVRRKVAEGGPGNLISVWQDSSLNDVVKGRGVTPRDYFVRMEGAAIRERGFHYWLAKFLNWKLPEVPRFDGTTTTLYLEAVASLFYVEQKRGWAGIMANLPTYLGIRDLSKRVIEFALKLQAFDTLTLRQRLQIQEGAVQQRWVDEYSRLESLMRDSGCRIANLPKEVPLAWPPKVPILVEHYIDNEWIALNEVIALLKERSRQLAEDPIRTTESSADALQTELVKNYSDLRDMETEAAILIKKLDALKNQQKAIDERLSTLKSDRDQYRDSIRIVKLGSTSTSAFVRSTCPTCEQPIDDVLLVQTETRRPMSLEDNLAYIEEQIETFSDMATGVTNELEVRDAQVRGLRTNISEKQTRIRAIRATLVSNANSPSLEQVQARVQVQGKYENLSNLRENIEISLGRLGDMAKENIDIRSRLQQIPKSGLVPDDEERIVALERSVNLQEQEYGFRSFDPSLLTISRDTYKPTREGYDIGFEASASDNIRLIWGYFLGLLEVARTYDSNHPNLLILDEPKQQDAKSLSFETLLRRSASAKSANQQIIFATSEPLVSIKSALANVECSMNSFDGRIFQKRT